MQSLDDKDTTESRRLGVWTPLPSLYRSRQRQDVASQVGTELKRQQVTRPNMIIPEHCQTTTQQPKGGSDGSSLGMEPKAAGDRRRSLRQRISPNSQRKRNGAGNNRRHNNKQSHWFPKVMPSQIDTCRSGLTEPCHGLACTDHDRRPRGPRRSGT
jgi:hypothetical protein